MQNLLISIGEKIIKPYSNVHLDFNDNCEMNAFKHTKKEIIANLCEKRLIPNNNYSIAINHFDQYFLKVNKPFIVSEACKNQPSSNHIFNTVFMQTVSEDSKFHSVIASSISSSFALVIVIALVYLTHLGYKKMVEYDTWIIMSETNKKQEMPPIILQTRSPRSTIPAYWILTFNPK